MSESKSSPKRSRVGLALLFAVGLVPVFVAYFVYVYFPQLLPTSTTNQGTLITPPVSNTLIDLSLTDSKWSLLLVLSGTCNEKCQKRFYSARQVNVALGKDSTRVKRIMLTLPGADQTTMAALAEKYPDMQQIEIDALKLTNALEKIVGKEVSNYIYLMDPNGNIMMFYSLDEAGNPMLKDVRHLLRISNIG